VLSFRGFDAISTLAEENREHARSGGRAMVGALVLAGALFVVQTWVAALLVPDREVLLTKGDAAGTAFYDAAAVAGGHWLSVLTAVATAVAWGFADALVAQAATSRLLFAMARDRQLPHFLRKIDHRHHVPVNATLLIAAISIGLGIYMAERSDGITLLSTMVNFGALTAFILLHVSVISHFVVRGGSRSPAHWLVPLCGIVILGYVLWSANLAAQATGLTWLGVGIVVAVGLHMSGRRLEVPVVPEEVEEERA
jgi:amino acid transporter